LKEPPEQVTGNEKAAGGCEMKKKVKKEPNPLYLRNNRERPLLQKQRRPSQDFEWNPQPSQHTDVGNGG
jgi:hypothetical protein